MTSPPRLQEEVVEGLVLQNHNLQETVQSLRNDIKSLTESRDKDNVQQEIALTSAKITIAELELAQRESAIQLRQLGEMDVTIKELTAVAEELRDQLARTITERTEVLAFVSEQEEEMNKLTTVNEQLTSLYDEQVRLNTLSNEIAKNHQELIDSLKTANEYARTERDAIKDVYEEILTEVARDNELLMQTADDLREEKLRLEMVVNGLKEQLTDHTSGTAERAVAPVIPPKIVSRSLIEPDLGFHLIPDEAMNDETRGRIIALEAEVKLLRQKGEEFAKWADQRSEIMSQYTTISEANTHLQEELNAAIHRLADAQLELKGQRAKLDAKCAEQQKLMLTPPTLAALELRCSRLGCYKLQQYILSLEDELCEDLWQQIPDIVYPRQCLDEVRLQNELRWRKDLVIAMTENVILTAKPGNLDELDHVIANQTAKIVNIFSEKIALESSTSNMLSQTV